MINKYIRECLSGGQLPDTYILSANFGLISTDYLIPNYDLPMTRQRVEELQQPTFIKLEHILNGKQYQEFFISMGKGYLRALDWYETLASNELDVTVAQGSMGRKLTELRNWLHKDSTLSPDVNTKDAKQGKVSLRGIKITLTSDQVIQKIKNALATSNNIPKYQMWYVQVGDRQVPVKWIVKQLTGLSVSTFHTSEAKRVLQQLGIEVYSKL